VNARLRYLCMTLVLAAAGSGYALMKARPWRPGPNLPAQRAAAIQPVPQTPGMPTARQILDRGRALSLTEDQRARLAMLDRRWKEETAPLEAALGNAEQEFAGFMKEAQAGGRASLQEIQRQSVEFRELSAELRDRRRHHAEAAAQVLTETQRRAMSLPGSPQSSGGDR
jgi:hypothetical protein